MKFLTADRIYNGTGAYLTDTVIVINDQGEVLDLLNIENIDHTTVKRIPGIIVPGFINAHCHLELSHMKGLLETGTGLIHFIGNVVSHRDAASDVIQDAIYKADQEMFDKGIVAVGDICNVMDTVKCKAESKLKYYNFVEIFDFLQPSLTKQSISQYGAPKPLLELSVKDKTNYVPHAPYSVSPDLMQFIGEQTSPDATISIHNQETPPENELFMKGTGAFFEFYKGFDLQLDHFVAPHKTAIHYILDHLAKDRKMLFVHNTLSTLEDIKAAQSVTAECYWATCPNANLYIENKLPDYQAFIDAKANVCIGTDSLTSNWQLDILEEMKTIQKYNSYIDFNTLIIWACSNGADALGFEDLGRIEKGKRPGLVQIKDYTIKPNGDLNIQSAVSKRIA